MMVFLMIFFYTKLSLVYILWFDCVCVKLCVVGVFSVFLFTQSTKTDDGLNGISLEKIHAINHNILKFCCFFDDCVNIDKIWSIFLLFFVHWLCKSQFTVFRQELFWNHDNCLKQLRHKLANWPCTIKTVGFNLYT